LDEIKKRLGAAYCVSALTGEGIGALADRVGTMFADGGEAPAGEILTNARQADAVRRALDSVRQARASIKAGVTPDAILTEIESAMSALGEITGRTVREDITARIFERFCVGK
jgi:tRNA modification GTPase